MKNLLTLVVISMFMVTAVSANAQIVGIAKGVVSNGSGVPIANHEVVLSDSANNVFSTVYTNNAGKYADTVLLGAAGTLTISTLDTCSGVYQGVYVPYNSSLVSGGYAILTRNFTICNSSSGGGATTAGCQASYTFDNSLSDMDQVVLYNTSTLDSLHTHSGSTTYLWEFGDGATSNLEFPTHNYLQSGTYELCLTITSIIQNTAGPDTCTDTYCDTVVVNSSASLNVYDSQSVGQIEYGVQRASLYPNPSSGFATLEVDRDSEIFIHSMDGLLVLHLNSSQERVQLPSFQPGTYMIRVIKRENYQSLRWIIVE